MTAAYAYGRTGSAAMFAVVTLIGVVAVGSAEPTHRPTRIFSVFSTLVSDEVIVTVARLTLSAASVDGSAVSTRLSPAVPLEGVTDSHPLSELTDQLVARPRLSRTFRVRVSLESESVFANATPLPSTSSLWDSWLNVTGTLSVTRSPLT